MTKIILFRLDVLLLCIKMSLSEDNKTNTAKLVTGLLLGLAAGALLGIALAPAKGSETRRKISDWLEDLGACNKNPGKDGTEKNDPEADRPV